MSSITLPDPTVTVESSPSAHVAGRRRWQRLVRGREADPAWVRPSLLALLVGTAVLYLWGLGASGWANSYYSAAAQAGSTSWKAFFFGSFDAASAITVDKPPASIWVMSLSARVFGVNAWSILVPQALMGAATVGVVYAAVRRWFTAGGALLAGAVVALTPVAVLMFRFNNPDPLLVLLLTAGAYAVLRALESASVRWLVLAGALVGLGFLTKMLQAFVVLPAFALAYLIAAPTSFWRRVWHLAVMGLTTLVAAGWWVVVVELWPASSRPYIGGSQTNSVLELVFGYNGFGRLTGEETGSVGGNGAVGTRWGETGWLRMFNDSFGGQISWLLPAALVLLATGLVGTIRSPRTDRTRAALVLWGGWLLVTGVVFSLGRGIIHEYYTVALAPASGAVIGIGAAFLWRRRSGLAARVALAGTVLVTAWWAIVLLDRSPGWNAWLRPLIGVSGVLAAGLLVTLPRLRSGFAKVAVAGAIVSGLAAPAAFSLATASAAQTGALPTAGPAVVGARSGPGGGFPGGGPPAGRAPGGIPGGATVPGALAGGGGATAVSPPGMGGGGGGLGGLLDASAPTDELVATLEADAGSYTWIAATTGANQAASYQLATDEAVLALGGFNGTDPSPTLEEFQAMVEGGQVHWFISGGMGGGPGGMGGMGGSSTISSWVTSTFSSVTVAGTTLYDLTSPL